MAGVREAGRGGGGAYAWGRDLDEQRVSMAGLHRWRVARAGQVACRRPVAGDLIVGGWDSASVKLRIGTWNLEYAAGAEKNAARRARLRAEDADVWILTETHDDVDLSASHTAVCSTQRPTGRAGGRWTVIWTRWPVVERLAAEDRERTVAAMLESPVGPLIVYGTVLPWHSDPGPDAMSPAKAWTEQDRVLRLQLAEWARLGERFPGVPLVVAGDLNMNLGGPHYYGTARGRRALREGLAGVGLACATETECVPAGALRHPHIDHVVVPAAWLPRSRVLSAWEGTTARGMRLSDHSGLVVEVDVTGMR